ncbi:hypothetical protein BLOT_007294 [Blomia tropicalis]|nr:hypothetical protein BLOT_007294 [Blomia tropicalis]
MKLTKPGLISSNNRVLRPFGFQIKRIFDSINKVTYYILANEIEDKLNISNTWSEKESNYYYAVLNTLIQSFMDKHQNMNPESIDYEFMSIGSTSAVNLARTVDITMTLADKLINYWTEMHWFEFCADKRITVGILTLSLMTSYLKKKFNIASCYSCSFACLIGIVCEQCSLTMHYHCGLEGFPSNDSYIRCPICITSKMSEVKCILPEREESSQSMERDSQDNETQDNDTQDVTMIDSD